MRALVTGGAGFIGSNLVDALIARGDEVVVVDNLSSGRRENLAGSPAQLVESDIRDARQMKQVFAEARPEVVFHLAAQVDVRKSIEDPSFDATTNVVGTVNVLEAAREAGARRLVNTSTGGGIYGEVGPENTPTPETFAPQPMGAYGQSKQCAEFYCLWEHRLYGFETVVLRYGNVYGERQDPHGDAGVLAIFCGLAAQAEGRPKVFGDGTQTRDYIYVGDVVRANLLAAEHPSAPGQVFNIGTQVQASVLDLVDALREALPAERAASFEPEFHPARLGEVQDSGLDATKAREVLGFSAETDLKSGIRTTLDWVRSL